MPHNVETDDAIDEALSILLSIEDKIEQRSRRCGTHSHGPS